MSATRPAVLDAPGAPIYLDCNGTTPVDPRVADAMAPLMLEGFGNPSSGHVFGRRARAAVDHARAAVAALLGCAPDEILLTSGGSESNNHALKGACWAARDRGRHVVTTAVEHPAVLEPLRWLERDGWETTVVGVDAAGRVDPAAVAAALRPDTVLVSVMLANNEVGTLQPVAEIAGLAQGRGVLVHCDAAQAVGKIPVDVEDLGVDLLSVAGHKVYAPKGVGALYVRRGTPLENLVHGAGQEGGRRAGTENVILAAGLGRAAELAREDVAAEGPRLAALRDRLAGVLRAAVPDLVVHGHPTQRLPNTLSAAFPGRLAASLQAACPGLACSAGAACHDVGAKPSAVLTAMGVAPEIAAGTLRLSLGRFTRADEVEAAGRMLGEASSR